MIMRLPGSACAILLLMPAALAHAQDDAPPAGNPKTLETIVVTGSHIRDIDLQDQHPIQILTREDLLRTGLTGVGDAVQALVIVNGQTNNRNSEAYSGGGPNVNLRGLGPNRTLVLVDGQRWVSALDGSVDLSTIPLPLVERIEVLKDGASAVYGSDAIAGVVNIITRNDFQGTQLGAQIGTSQYGDGTTRALDVTFGSHGSKWNVALGLQYGDDSPIYARDRAITALPDPGLPLAATGGPFTVYVLPDYTFLTLTPGRPGTSPGDFHEFDQGRDRGFNFQQYTYLQAPEKRRSAFAKVRYGLSTDIAFSADFLFNRRESSEFAAPPILLFDSLDFIGPAAFSIPAENVYNPFGQPVASVFERLIGLGPRFYDQTVDTTWLHLGMDGSFEVSGRNWVWNLDLTRANSKERALGGPYARNDELERALGPSFIDASGVARCGTPDDIIGGCVPLNVFGGADAAMPAARSYFRYTLREHLSDAMTALTAKVSGALFDVPAGAVNAAAGIEHRRVSGYDHPDPIEVAGQANGDSGVDYRAATSGAYHVDEAFAEFDVPLLSQHELAKRLDFTVADRYSRYSAFGSTNNAQFGLRWKPTDAVLLRANYAQGFRAPSINDLFSGAQAFTAQPPDPCVSGDGYAPTPAVVARCARLGVPADAPPPNLVNATLGGNPELRPETSRTRTLGVVVAPLALPNLTVSLDWYDVRVQNAITQKYPYYFLQECYVHASDSACMHITRAANGQLVSVAANEVNLPSGQETEGYDLALGYRRDTNLGRWQLQWQAVYVSYFGELGKPARGSPLPDGSTAQGNTVGNDPVWRIRSVATLQWDRAAWTASVTVRYFSPLNEDCSFVVETAYAAGDPSLLNLCTDPFRTLDGNPDPTNRIPSVTYFDLSAGWRAPWGGRFTLGLRNAFDRAPPPSRSRGGGADPFVTDYDPPGRFYFLGYQQKF
ncbi:MAG TPA: TonB-dependent receptor [Rhodanobacteraceae bacterium]|nr:TonB-dependent receptor [Rhodanobacteraceae bacterium]